MSASVVIPGTVHDAFRAHLLRLDGQEDLAFGIWYPSAGAERRTALVRTAMIPDPGDRIVNGNVAFTSAYFLRALNECLKEGAGLCLAHSHPSPGWQGLSSVDARTESRLARACLAATGLPLVGMTLGTDGSWSARFWNRIGRSRYAAEWCESVRVVGKRLDFTFHPTLRPPPSKEGSLRRSYSAWGEKNQAKIARTHVGIIGLGSVGSIVAESLARMGVERITLVDFDLLDELNLDRTIHATRDAANRHDPKVEVIGEAIEKSATARRPTIRRIFANVGEEPAFRAMLDCDVVLSCVDRPWGRQVLNFAAFAHMIPVVDGGILTAARRSGDGLRRADWRAHTVMPGRRCLECLGQFDPGMVAVDREGLLDKPGYIEGLPSDHPLRRNENVFAFALSTAAMMVLQFLALEVLESELADQGARVYHFAPGTIDIYHQGCEPTCPYPALTALGDRTGLVVTGPSAVAEANRRLSQSVSGRS